MPGPSDIRVNPFNNATNYVNLTEQHIVPSVSPFVVRLNEVPEKQDPSNMQMFYVDDATGQTTETALTEVAATPGAGEFRPDYSTNAFDDTSWNTGLIEFGSADAGKIIEVSYTATGTLAGVKTHRYPACWLDRGDGSDGAFNPSSNITISGEKNYTSVFIPAGVTVNVNRYAAIKCLGSFVNNGIVSANGQGASGGSGGSSASGASEGAADGRTGGTGITANGGAGGAIHYGVGYANRAGAGGAGGGCYASNISITNSIAVDLCKYSAEIGIGAGGGGGGGAYHAPGGAGGAGGGAIKIITDSLKNKGKITANGNGGEAGPGGGSGGGGAGGSILIVATTIIETGTITVDGGDGGSVGGAAKGGTGVKFIKELGGNL